MSILYIKQGQFKLLYYIVIIAKYYFEMPNVNLEIDYLYEETQERNT